MPPTDGFSRALAIESWTLYAIGLLAICARLAARRIHFGSFRKFQLDDYVILAVVLPFTVVIIAAKEVSEHGSNYSRLRPGNDIIEADELDDVIWGSKMSFVLEEMLVVTLWLLKACLLLMYHRLTIGLWQQTVIKFVAIYCAIGFVVMEVLLFALWCRPFNLYWAVPVPSNRSQCATYYHHMVVATVFNLSSDIMILLIPLPILINSMMPLKRKILLCLVFSLGIFVILAAVLNRYYNFTQKYSLIYLNWYVGEVSVAVIATNIPLMWPLFRRIFILNSWGSSENSGTTDTSAAALQSHGAKHSSIPGVATSGIVTDESSRMSGLARRETRGSSRLDWNNGLSDIRGYTGSRPRGQSSLGIEDVDIDLELGQLSGGRSSKGPCTNLPHLREINAGENIDLLEESGQGRATKKNADLQQNAT